MSTAVDQVLADRSRRAPRAEMVSVAAAIALHGLLAATVLIAPRFQPAREPLEFVPVQIIPAQALGVQRPAAPRPRPAPPKPAAQEAAPAQPEPARPEPEPEPEKPAPKPVNDAPVLPREDAKKPEKARSTPSETSRKPPGPTAPSAPRPPRPEAARPETGRPGTGQGKTGTGSTGRPDDTGDQVGRRGSPTGNPLGTAAFGSEIAGLDNPDFTYGYYTDQLLSRIDQNWVRPSLGEGIRAIISFRIQRDGSILDLAVKETSGFGVFDLAALRAVQNASPFPPLPRAYRQDSLGVNLIVR